MGGMVADTPSKPFGGAEEITFTPDGKGLVFTSRDVGNEEPWSTDFDLYYVPIEGGVSPRCLTEDNPAWDTQPVFSPDGKTLAYLAMKRARYEADRFRIVLYSWETGEKRTLTEKWDRSPSGFCWSDDGKTIYATASNLGQNSLFAVNIQNAQVKALVAEGYCGSPSGRRSAPFWYGYAEVSGGTIYLCPGRQRPESADSNQCGIRSRCPDGRL